MEGKQYIYSNSPLISIDMILMLERYGAKPLAYYVISKNDFERELFPEFKHSNVDPLVALLADFGKVAGDIQAGLFYWAVKRKLDSKNRNFLP